MPLRRRLKMADDKKNIGPEAEKPGEAPQEKKAEPVNDEPTEVETKAEPKKAPVKKAPAKKTATKKK